MTDKAQLNTFLAEQKYMTVAVTLDDGTPWAVPIRIKLQWGIAFEWDSMLDTVHSKAIAKRPQVALSIWTPDGDSTAQFGFGARASAELVSDKAGMGRYRATVSKCWITDATFVKREVELA